MSTDGDTVGVALVQAAWDASLLEVRQKGSAEGPFTLHQIELRFGKLVRRKARGLFRGMQ